ncbi:hypothetical protein FRB94_009958 [Tulasnella sp. JGI-2019a]|nr:hypothetical protein FRB94_009958 [Tulasnella sp. JGI-2019a]KAG9002091.1 hypothetical protein FRB93_011864 [Tulasnella sp. JGI-2019a]KAG9032045.1 hypothetical protein FRB95_001997 [Tulasnella sp. JGI-2019a]
MRAISIATLALIAAIPAASLQHTGTMKSAPVSLERRAPMQDSATQNIQNIFQATATVENAEEHARMTSNIFDDEEGDADEDGIKDTTPRISLKMENSMSSSAGDAVLSEEGCDIRVAAVFANFDTVEKKWSRWRSEFMDRESKRITDGDAERLTELYEIIRHKILPGFDALVQGQKTGERALRFERMQRGVEGTRNALAQILLDHYSVRAARAADLDMTKCANMLGLL